MKIINSIEKIKSLTRELKKEGQKIGFVPTMGALHAGHLSLISEAKRKSDYVVISVFVNPLQFNSPKDLETYPSTLEADIEASKNAGADCFFAPSLEDVYPKNSRRAVKILAGDLADDFCGKHRPGHFDGVVTVVSILFNLVKPDVAVFGEKDFQQLNVIRQMVRDLHYDIEIVGAPLIREHDGLAMSSRNVRLNEKAREESLRISKSLFLAKKKLEEGVTRAGEIKEIVSQNLANEVVVEYVEVIDRLTLEPISEISGSAQVLVAANVGGVRLIDNICLVSNGEKEKRKTS